MITVLCTEGLSWVNIRLLSLSLLHMSKMYFIQHLLLNFKLIQQISQILSHFTVITKFSCTFENTVYKST